jgi:hypothetical protein
MVWRTDHPACRYLYKKQSRESSESNELCNPDPTIDPAQEVYLLRELSGDAVLESQLSSTRKADI